MSKQTKYQKLKLGIEVIFIILFISLILFLGLGVLLGAWIIKENHEVKNDHQLILDPIDQLPIKERCRLKEENGMLAHSPIFGVTHYDPNDIWYSDIYEVECAKYLRKTPAIDSHYVTP